MKGYTTIENVEDYSLIDIALSFQGSFESILESVEALIDQETGRNFVADTEASAKYYHGTGSPFLKIDDCIAIEKVEHGSVYGNSFTEKDEDDYILVPRTGTPIKGIYLKNTYWQIGQYNHRITAKWGYSESAPADIRFVATVLASGIIKNNVKTKGDVVSEKIGDYNVSYDTDRGLNDFNRAKAILDSYKLFLI